MLPHRTPTCFELIVYEDFVSQYDPNGKKVHILVLTIVWRNAEGLLQRMGLDNKDLETELHELEREEAWKVVRQADRYCDHGPFFRHQSPPVGLAVAAAIHSRYHSYNAVDSEGGRLKTQLMNNI
jgi:hypothetical protein